MEKHIPLPAHMGIDESVKREASSSKPKKAEESVAQRRTNVWKIIALSILGVNMGGGAVAAGMHCNHQDAQAAEEPKPKNTVTAPSDSEDNLLKQNL